ncbi:Annexin A7 [Taenia crassiceps]|uniref:Annexin n=1 Tax=Taenia crassiceps TaxID=6207 RepID=A0ABR4QG09_9CEST
MAVIWPPTGQSRGVKLQQAMPRPPSCMRVRTSARGGAAPRHRPEGITIHHIMLGRPTIRPFPAFNADEDAEELRQAMKGIGTDEARIIKVLANRSASQRKAIASRYLALFGKHLEKDLKRELTGNFEEVVLASLQDVAEMKACALRKAMKGAGTKEHVLIQVIAVASNSELQQIKHAYQTIVERDLEKDISSETSGDFRCILVAMLQAQRDENPNVNQAQVEVDADALYKSGEGRMGTEESRFTQIFSQRSFQHIKEIAKTYAIRYKKTLIEAIKSETSGDYRETLITIVSFAEDQIVLYVKWLQDSMVGMGTRDDDLIRLILSSAEINLGDIKEAYQRKTNKLLTNAIQSETSGDYKRMLIAIVEGNA